MTNGRLSLFFFPLQTSQPERGRRKVLRTSGEPSTQREYSRDRLIILITVCRDGEMKAHVAPCPVCLVSTKPPLLAKLGEMSSLARLRPSFSGLFAQHPSPTSKKEPERVDPKE